MRRKDRVGNNFRLVDCNFGRFIASVHVSRERIFPENRQAWSLFSGMTIMLAFLRLVDRLQLESCDVLHCCVALLTGTARVTFSRVSSQVRLFDRSAWRKLHNRFRSTAGPFGCDLKRSFPSDSLECFTCDYFPSYRSSSERETANVFSCRTSQRKFSRVIQ